MFLFLSSRDSFSTGFPSRAGKALRQLCFNPIPGERGNLSLRYPDSFNSTIDFVESAVRTPRSARVWNEIVIVSVISGTGCGRMVLIN